MKKTLLLLLSLISYHLSTAQYLLDSCFSSATPSTTFIGSTTLSDANDADLMEWDGTQWVGSWSNALVDLVPPCDSAGVRAIWVGDDSLWTTGGEAFGMMLSTPLVSGQTYTFTFTYVSNGLYSTGTFAPDFITNNTGTLGGTNVGTLSPAGNTWTTLPFTFTAIPAQNGDNWIVIHSNTGSGMVLGFCSPCAPSIPPVAAFSTVDTTLCPGTCINFTNLSQNATAYQWLFPGAIPSSDTTANPATICYSNSGTYSVTLTASNGSGLNTYSIINYITVFAAPSSPSIIQSGDTLYAGNGYTGYQWYYGSDTIAGATNSFYVATQDGNYNLIVTDENGCSVGAGILNVVTSLTPTVSKEEGVSVYPNPTRGSFELKYYSEKNSLVTIEFISSLGQVIYRKEVQMKQGTNTLSFGEGLGESGIYLLKITEGEKIITKEIIIEK